MGQPRLKDIPYGYCHCGCGQKTKTSTMTRNHLGYKRGEPSMYKQGHALKNVSGPDHPLWKGGLKKINTGAIALRCNGTQILVHRLIAEKALGHPLPRKAQVHHANSKPNDNRNENLVVCEDDLYHKLLHKRTKALQACGHASWMKCNYCHQYDDPKNLQISPTGRRVCHPHCGAIYNAQYREKMKKRREKDGNTDRSCDR